jgi:hypothetical protein
VTWIVLGTLAVVAAAIAIGVLVDRKVGLLPRPRDLLEAGKPGTKPAPHAPGEAPETALATPPRTVHCRACHASTQLEGTSRTTYGDRELVVQRHRCTSCATITRIYCEAS